MKTFKLTKGVQIILISLLVLIVGVIAVGALSNNKTMAATDKCEGCGQTGTFTEIGYNETHHGFRCSICGVLNKKLPHSPAGDPIKGEGIDNGDGTHYATYECDVCNQKYVDKETKIEHEWGEPVNTDPLYHTATCEFCPAEDQNAHEFIYTYKDENVHSVICGGCDMKKGDGTEAHADGFADGGQCKCIVISNELGCPHCGKAGRLRYTQVSTTEHREWCSTCSGNLVGGYDKIVAHKEGNCPCGFKGSTGEGTGTTPDCANGYHPNYKDTYVSSAPGYHDVTRVCNDCGETIGTWDEACTSRATDNKCPCGYTITGNEDYGGGNGGSGGGGGRRQRKYRQPRWKWRDRMYTRL